MDAYRNKVIEDMRQVINNIQQDEHYAPNHILVMHLLEDAIKLITNTDEST
jgi:hypothetical protein